MGCTSSKQADSVATSVPHDAPLPGHSAATISHTEPESQIAGHQAPVTEESKGHTGSSVDSAAISAPAKSSAEDHAPATVVHEETENEAGRGGDHGEQDHPYLRFGGRFAKDVKDESGGFRFMLSNRD